LRATLERLLPRGLTLRAATAPGGIPSPTLPSAIFSELTRGAGYEGLQQPVRYSELVKRYGSAVWVYAAVHRKAADLAAVPLCVYSVRGETETELPETHPLVLLLDTVNPHLAYYDLRELDAINLDLSGNAYWLCFGPASGPPTEIWPINPSWVTIVPDRDTFIRGYVIRPEGLDPYFFEPIAQARGGVGVLHFKRANPRNAFYGQGSLEAAWGAVMIDEKATAYRHDFYKNSARPDGVIETPREMNPAAVEHVKAWWKEAFAAAQGGAHRIGILPFGLTYKAISFSPKDQDIIADRRLSREDILVAFGVSLAVLGIETGDVGRRDEQIKHYYESTIKPEAIKYANHLNEFLAPRFGPDLQIRPDFSHVRVLNEANLVRAQVDEIHLRTGRSFINELRARDGEKPVPWGNKPLVPFSTVPLGEGPEYGLFGGTGESNSGATPTGRAISGRSYRRLVADTEETRAALWLDFVDKASVRERTWAADLRRIMDATRRDMAAVLERGEGAEAALRVVHDTMHPLLVATARKHLPGVLEAGWDRAARLVRQAVERAALAGTRKQSILELLFDIAIPRLAEHLAHRPIQYADTVTGNLSDGFRALLASASNEGQSIQEMADTMSERWEVIAPARAVVIARTEVISASNLAAKTAYEESGVVERQEWLSARDARVRPDHVDADGQVVALGALFNVGGEGLAYPGDPAGSPENIIQCRCTTLPVVEMEA